MKMRRVQIGNSREMATPQNPAEQSKFSPGIPAPAPRKGWEEAIEAAGPFTQDELLLDHMPESDFDREEWHW